MGCYGNKFKSGRTHTETVYIFCIQKLYKIYTTDVHKIIQNVYKIKKPTPPKFCIQNVYKSLSKCGIHFVYKHFVQILYTKVCRNMEYILYTNILYIFCIHFVYISSDLLKADIINIMYTKMYIQIIVCRMDLLFQHIFTHLLCTS